MCSEVLPLPSENSDVYRFLGRAAETCCWKDMPFFWWSSKPAYAVSQCWNNCTLDRAFSAECEKISNGNGANLSLPLEKEDFCGPVAWSVSQNWFRNEGSATLAWVAAYCCSKRSSHNFLCAFVCFIAQGCGQVPAIWQQQVSTASRSILGLVMSIPGEKC